MRLLGVVLVALVLSLVSRIGIVECEKPAVVNVGSVFTFNSIIGRAAKAAMDIAVSDINGDPSILAGTKLNLIQVDSNCSGFLASIGAFQLIEKEVVTIIGPQSSAIAHMISFIANDLHVPLVSFAASDPTLSAFQFPYFVRMTQSDSYQMTALADIICSYGWKESIAIYVDDDYGRNGIAYLGDELARRQCKIHFKLPLSINFDPSDLTRVLNGSKNLGPRVYVVHIYPDSKLRFFSLVQKLNMMTEDFVWLVTDWLSSSLESFSMQNQSSLRILDGVVGLRPYIPKSTKQSDFVSRWRKMQQKDLVQLTTYGMYAYDTVWAVAHSIDKLLREGINISFSFRNDLHAMGQSSSQLNNLKVFEGGESLLKILTDINFTGITGKINFDGERNLIGSGYEVINIAQGEIHSVGYWSNLSALSVSPVKSLKRKAQSCSDKKLGHITWPGGQTSRPRGWVLANAERPYQIAVPRRTVFTEFVRLNESHKIEGYCIDVFNAARDKLPYDIHFTFKAVGDGHSNPNYDDLVKKVADDVFDAAVGDIAIVTNRTRMVDFTQPYVSTGLVILAPVDRFKSSAWVFLKPFTPAMWGVTAISFLVIAVVIWILEHRVNDDFRGPPKRQLITMLLFSFSTLFKTNNENTVSTLGRMVMVVWLFLLLVITSSYTASLTSILTVQQLSSSTITGMESLVTTNWPIGYQVGSFAYSYLINNYDIHPSRLVKLRSPEEYEIALRKGPTARGGVAAVVDELPYVELFLANRTEFGTIGQQFARNGWGFVFQKGSPIAVDLSTEILKLAENGDLYKIHKKWFCGSGCPSERGIKAEAYQLHLSSFWGLYLLCGAVTVIALIIFLFRAVFQYMRYKRKQMDPSSPSNTRCSQAVYSFFDFIDEKEEAIKHFFTQHESSQTQVNNEAGKAADSSRGLENLS
nr:glutamate receptor 3.7 isoform X1 [Ipomoea batatas]